MCEEGEEAMRSVMECAAVLPHPRHSSLLPLAGEDWDKEEALMRLEGSKRARKRAKELREEMTAPEVALWLALRANDVGLRFRKQHSAGEYILDFYCDPARLAIEVDGEVHERGDRPAREEMRDRWLTEQGVRVVRYAARDVLANVEGVATQVTALAMRRIEPIEGLGKLRAPRA